MPNNRGIVIVGFGDADSLLAKAIMHVLEHNQHIICAAEACESYHANPGVGRTHMSEQYVNTDIIYKIENNRQKIAVYMDTESSFKKPDGWYRKFEKKRKWQR